LILENCIEKNFHVSNMRAVRMRFRRIWMQFQDKNNVYVSTRSRKEHTGGYLGITGDEGRSKLR
jgi:hypothetical protein